MTAPLSIVVDFWRPEYHGLLEQPRFEPEWPPAPFRLAQALMAGCHRPDYDVGARQALEALVRLDNPSIFCARHDTADLPGTYTHRSDQGTIGESLGPLALKRIVDLSIGGLEATNRTEKPVGVVHLHGTRVVYQVDDPQGTVDADALDRAARRVPYLGRSHDGCDISVTRGADDSTEGLRRRRPHFDPRGSIRGWTAQSCTWMDREFDAASSGRGLPRLSPEPYLTRLRYTADEPPGRSPQTASMLIVPTAQSIPSRRVPHFLEQHVRGVMSDQPQVRAFPCVSAGYPFADGRMRGIGLAGAHIDDVRRAALALLDSRAFSLDPPGGPRRVTEPARWQASSRRWISATPLRAFPDVRVADDVVGAEIEAATGQRPTTITWVRDGGGSHMHPWQHSWSQLPDGFGLWWAELAFQQPTAGPLLAGRDTDRGFGLFVPWKGDKR